MNSLELTLDEPMIEDLVALNTSYLTLARTLAKHKPSLCYPLFGLTEAEIQRLAKCNLTDLQRMARSECMLFRPRPFLNSYLTNRPEDSLRDILRDLAVAKGGL